MLRKMVCWSILAALLSSTAPAAAQELPEDAVGEAPSEAGSQQEGGNNWNGALSIGGNLNFVSNQNVVGQTDGTSALVGLSVDGDADYRAGSNEFRGQLVINESFARTPTIEQFVKNNDVLRLEGIYNRYFLPWSGAFGLLSTETSIFENYNVTAAPESYRLLLNDGSEQTRTAVGRLRLSEMFRPTSLNQSAGVFANPVETTPFTVRTRAGLGARETFADGVFVIDDDPDTPELEARELDNVYQGGFEAFVGANGAFPEQNLTYEVGVTGLLPVLNNDPEDRGALELTRVGFTGSLTFAAFDWLSANYNVQVTRDPQLVEDTQIQNNVLLTLKYNLIQRREADQEPSPEEQLEEAQNRIEELETRIQELEEDDDEEGPESESSPESQ